MPSARKLLNMNCPRRRNKTNQHGRVFAVECHTNGLRELNFLDMLLKELCWKSDGLKRTRDTAKQNHRWKSNRSTQTRKF